MDTNRVLVSAPVLFKQGREGVWPLKNGNYKYYWFLTKKPDEDKWELPKVMVRKAESSVRASIRMMSDKGSMDIKVLEEAGRAGGTTKVNGKIKPKRTLYYLAVRKSGGEILGFEEFEWLPYAKAVRRLSSKRERKMLKNARKELREWKKRQEEEEE